MTMEWGNGSEGNSRDKGGSGGEESGVEGWGGRGEIETVREDRDPFLSDEAHGQQLSTSGGDVDIFLHIELIFSILDPR